MNSHGPGPVSGIAFGNLLILTFLQPVFDVSAVTQPLQPFLKSRIRLARTYRLTGGLALPLLAYILGTALDNLNQVPAKRRLNGLADLAGFKRIHCLLELRYGVARRDPAEVATLWRGGIFRMGFRQLFKLAAVLQALFQIR